MSKGYGGNTQSVTLEIKRSTMLKQNTSTLMCDGESIVLKSQKESDTSAQFWYAFLLKEQNNTSILTRAGSTDTWNLEKFFNWETYDRLLAIWPRSSKWRVDSRTTRQMASRQTNRTQKSGNT